VYVFYTCQHTAWRCQIKLCGQVQILVKITFYEEITSKINYGNARDNTNFRISFISASNLKKSKLNLYKSAVVLLLYIGMQLGICCLRTVRWGACRLKWAEKCIMGCFEISNLHLILLELWERDGRDVMRISELWSTYEILVRKPEGKRLGGRPKYRW
jgi:hypothetical protein